MRDQYQYFCRWRRGHGRGPGSSTGTMGSQYENQEIIRSRKSVRSTNVNHGAVRGLWGGLVVGEFNQMKVNQILKVKS